MLEFRGERLAKSPVMVLLLQLLCCAAPSSGVAAGLRVATEVNNPHEQPYCHLLVSKRGLGMHLPVTSLDFQVLDQSMLSCH